MKSPTPTTTFLKYSELFIFLGLIIFLSLSVSIIGFNGLYGQDGHDYLHFSRSIKNFINSGIPISHYLHPFAFPFLGYLLTFICFNDIFAMQLVSILSLAFLFIYLRRLIILTHNSQKHLNIYLISFLIFSPYVLRFGILIMSDMLCTVLCTAAFYHSIKYSKTKIPQDLILTIIFSTIAFQTRYAAWVILLFPAYLLIKTILINKKYIYLLFSLLMIGIFFLPEYLLRHRLLIFDLDNPDPEQSYHLNTSAWSVLNFFKRDFINSDGESHYLLPNILCSFINLIHPAYLFCGIIFLFFFRKQDISSKPETKLTFASIIIYLLFLSGLTYQISRYPLLTFPFVLLLFYPAFLRIMEKYFTSSGKRMILFSFVVILQLSFFIYSIRIIYQLNQTELKVANVLQKYKGKTIYTCSIDIALQTYIPNKLINLYYNNISTPEANSLLLYNQKEFTDHWGTYHPDKTYQQLSKENNLVKIESLPNDWELYEIK